MRTNKYLAITLLSGVSVFAQTTERPAPPEVLKPEAYVRRVSLGASLSVSVLNFIPNRSQNVVTSSPAVDSLYNTSANVKRRVGFGGTAQFLITDRFAVTAGFFHRKIGYQMNTDIYEGVDNPNTVADERRHTIRNEDTRARFYDMPVTIRYFGKDRYDPGPRWFVEGGAALRRVSHIRTSIDTTVNLGETQCCDTTPTSPARRTTRGLVGGFGVQITDPIGIRVVPSVRFTRWAGQPFSSFSTGIERNQLEAMISLTF